MNGKSASWKVFTFVVVGVAYVALVSEGLRNLIAAFALRLHKLPLPGFAALRNYLWSYRLDLAHLFALLLMTANWFTWVLVLRVYLGGRVRGGWDPVTYTRFVTGLGLVLLGCDCVLFYLAMAEQSWGEGGLAFAPAVATVLYVSILLFVSFVSVYLEPDRKGD